MSLSQAGFCHIVGNAAATVLSSQTSVVGVVLLLVLRVKEQSAMNERGAAVDVGIAVAVRATTKGMGIIVWNLKCQQMCKSIFNLPL